MGLISRFGAFLDRLFEPKVTRQELFDLRKLYDSRLDGYENSFGGDQKVLHIFMQETMQAISKLTEDSLKLRDELNAIKALYKIGGTQKPNTQTPGSAQKFDGSQAWKR